MCLGIYFRACLDVTDMYILYKLVPVCMYVCVRASVYVLIYVSVRV